MRIRVNFKDWLPFAAGALAISDHTRFRILLSEPAALWAVNADEEKLLLGYGTEFEGECEMMQAFTSDVPGVIYCRCRETFEASGVPLTNFDKQPMESPLMREVRQYMRLQQLEMRGQMQRIREATTELVAARAEAGLPNQEVELEREPDADDVLEAEADAAEAEDAKKAKKGLEADDTAD